MYDSFVPSGENDGQIVLTPIAACDTSRFATVPDKEDRALHAPRCVMRSGRVRATALTTSTTAARLETRLCPRTRRRSASVLFLLHHQLGDRWRPPDGVSRRCAEAQ